MNFRHGHARSSSMRNPKQKGARIGLVQNAGGDIGGVSAASAVHVLGK